MVGKLVIGVVGDVWGGMLDTGMILHALVALFSNGLQVTFAFLVTNCYVIYVPLLPLSCHSLSVVCVRQRRFIFYLCHFQFFTAANL